MKKRTICSIVLLLSLSFLVISIAGQKKSETLAMINGQKITYGEFQRQIALESMSAGDLKLSKKEKEALLKQFIQRELLIQEAKRRNLDKTKKFLGEIESQWKLTLIKDLLEEKGKRVCRTTESVPLCEIKSCYEKMKNADQSVKCFAEMKDQIAKELREERRRENLEQWIANLKKEADIKVNRAVLFKNPGKS